MCTPSLTNAYHIAHNHPATRRQLLLQHVTPSTWLALHVASDMQHPELDILRSLVRHQLSSATGPSLCRTDENFELITITHCKVSAGILLTTWLQ